MSSRPHHSASASSPAPKTVKLKPHQILSLPYRLTHPPPPQPKAPSWGITPHFRIPLEEILDRKHLPPLGLKDFEEWLLYIDHASECLYFVLWLREYKARYTAWRKQWKPSVPLRCPSSPHAPSYRSLSAPPPPNPALTQFYMRAKETFLTPYAPYALPVPSDLLYPFYSSLEIGPNGRRPSFPFAAADPLLPVPGQPPPPPYPEIFEEIEERVIALLSDSLDRFVLATFHNVGMPRAYCGCAGGTVIGLTGSAPILLANFLTGGSRWWRFSALPGLWLGMTIVISAMYGVCMMVYVFGDLRQLRSFELARVPEIESSEKESKSKPVLRLQVTPASIQHLTDSSANHSVLPLTSPPLLQMRRSVSGESNASPSDGPHLPMLRQTPPMLRLTPPEPAHTITHVYTSSRPRPLHTQMQSMSSASTSYSMHPSKPEHLRAPEDTIDDVDDGYSEADSDCDSDYDCSSESDASSDGSHASDAGDEATADAELTAKSERRRRQARRRRRREPEIHISDAIFDDDPSPEGPAIADAQQRSRRSSMWGETSDEDVGPGATFIHPFRWDHLEAAMCSHDIESQASCAAERQRIDAFDFDGLPRRPMRHSRTNSNATSLPSAATPVFAQPAVVPHIHPVDLEKPSRGVRFASGIEPTREHASPASPSLQHEIPQDRLHRFLGFLQTKCVPRNVAMYFLDAARDSTSTVTGQESVNGSERAPELRTSVSGGPISPTSTLSPPSIVWPGSPTSAKPPAAFPPKAPGKTSFRKRVRAMLHVPAFSSPLTPVLNPIVTRGQWEIVVRSAIMALVISAVIIGGLVGAPVTRVV